MPRYALAVEAHQEGALVRLRVAPGASSTRLAGLHADRVKLRVSAPPAGGRANDEAIAYLAQVLGVRRRDLTLISGERSRSKALLVRGLAPDAVAGLLADSSPPD